MTSRASSNPIARFLRFLEHGVWTGRLDRMTPWKRRGISVLRVVSYLLASFRNYVSSLQAGGLTLVSLLALVPVLAMVFAFGKSFGFAKMLDERLEALKHDLPPDLAEAIDSLRRMVAEVDFGALGLIGAAAIVWAGLVLFQRVEQALNHVWRTPGGRAWYRRITDFVTILVVVPPLVLAALGANSIVGSVGLIEGMRQIEAFDWLFAAGMGFVPHVLLWIAFAALYKIMPTAHVRWTSAAIGGIAAGSALVLLNHVYVAFQIGVANANALYGTLAALPLLIIYLQLGWTVVLAGAEVSFVVQNLHSLRGTEKLPPPTHAVRQRMAWHFVAEASKAFRAGDRGVHSGDVTTKLDVPAEWAEEVVHALLAAKLLVRAEDDPDVLIPARPPEQIHAAQVVRALDGELPEGIERVRLSPDQEKQLQRATSAVDECLEKLNF